MEYTVYCVRGTFYHIEFIVLNLRPIVFLDNLSVLHAKVISDPHRKSIRLGDPFSKNSVN